MKREILQEPDPRLSYVAIPWSWGLHSAEWLRVLVADLTDTVGHDLGLAAPQIGEQVRVLVARIPVLTVCVNPEWTPTGAKRPGFERCLSVADRYRVFRHIAINAQWFTVDGAPRSARLTGLDAVVFQHEVDHLEGMTIARKR